MDDVRVYAVAQAQRVEIERRIMKEGGAVDIL